MIKVENIHVDGFEAAIRGMRNPKNSWEKSDSGWEFDRIDDNGITVFKYKIGPADMDLAQRLFKGGNEHRKFLRMIHVSMDVTAPLYWWKEADTYKVATVADSCSTMHKIAAKEFTIDDFSHEHLKDFGGYYTNVYPHFITSLERTIAELNEARLLYLEADFNVDHPSKKDYWWQMIQLLPTSYNQKRTWDLNYETIFTIIRQRTGHKLDEWNELVDIFKDLPYVREIGVLD